MVVVESAAHRFTRLPRCPAAAGSADGARMRTERPPTARARRGDARGHLHAAARREARRVIRPVDAAAGQRLPAGVAGRRRRPTTELSRRLVIADGRAEGVLQVVAQAATCDAEAEFPACHLSRQDWGVPIRVGPDGAARLPLILRGLDELTIRQDP